MREQFQVILSTAQEGPTGIILYVTDTDFRCVDRNQGEVTLTSGQRKFLRKLACNVNCTVSYQALYEAYSKTNVDGDDSAIPGYVIKMRDSFRDPPRDQIKRSIKSVRREGYRLLGTRLPWNTSNPAPEAPAASLTHLAGDHYGFYLDSLGGRKMLSAYIHIENADTAEAPNMTAYAILGIRSTKLLFREELSELFQRKEQRYEDAFKEFKRTLGDNDKRCYWGHGSVKLDGDIATICLSTKENGSGRWQIMLDMSSYFNCGRERVAETDLYRGGLGLTMVMRGTNGVSCFRFGMVRKFFGARMLQTYYPNLQSRLGLLDDSEKAQWKPLELNTTLDREWYEWIMSSQS